MASTFDNSSFIQFHVCLIVLQRPYAKVLYHFLYNHFVEVPNQWNFQIVVMFICLLKFPFNSFLLSIFALTINLVIPHHVCTRLFVFFFILKRKKESKRIPFLHAELCYVEPLLYRRLYWFGQRYDIFRILVNTDVPFRVYRYFLYL